MKNAKLIWFALYLAFGLYFINSTFSFISLPEFVTGIDKWITLIGGVLILLGGFNHFKANKAAA